MGKMSKNITSMWTAPHALIHEMSLNILSRLSYTQLVEENRRRGRQGLEFELLDTGVFASNRYFDVIVEYASSPELF